MRYWKLKDDELLRVISANVQMSKRWIEITFKEYCELRNKIEMSKPKVR
jgi:hypothetical protein